MADLVFNVALGSMAEWFRRVDANDPAGCVLRVFIIDANGDTDAAMKDRNDFAALVGGTANEVTNSGYANIALTDSDIAFVIDDGNDRVDLDIPDQTFSSVGSGDAWTDLIIAWDDDGTDTDSNTLCGTLHDFVVTPDGSDITAQINSAGFFRAS